MGSYYTDYGNDQILRSYFEGDIDEEVVLAYRAEIEHMYKQPTMPIGEIIYAAKVGRVSGIARRELRELGEHPISVTNGRFRDKPLSACGCNLCHSGRW